MAPLQEGTLVEAIMAVRGQIDFLWQFFVTVHIALFALLFIYDHAVENLNAIAKFFAVLGVAAFEWINGNALAHTYLLLDAMQDQFRWNYGQADRFHPAFYEQFVLASYATRPRPRRQPPPSRGRTRPDCRSAARTASRRPGPPRSSPAR